MQLNLIHPEMNICSYGDCTTAFCVIVIGGDIYCKRHAIDALCGAELAALRARVGELERERDAVKETLAVALVALWKSHDSNDDDRDTVSDELASKHFATWEEIFALETAALAKGAK